MNCLESRRNRAFRDDIKRYSILLKSFLEISWTKDDPRRVNSSFWKVVALAEKNKSTLNKNYWCGQISNFRSHNPCYNFQVRFCVSMWSPRRRRGRRGPLWGWWGWGLGWAWRPIQEPGLAFAGFGPLWLWIWGGRMVCWGTWGLRGGLICLWSPKRPGLWGRNDHRFVAPPKRAKQREQLKLQLTVTGFKWKIMKWNQNQPSNPPIPT